MCSESCFFFFLLNFYIFTGFCERNIEQHFFNGETTYIFRVNNDAVKLINIYSVLHLVVKDSLLAEKVFSSEKFLI